MPGLLPHIDPDGLLEFSVVYTDRALNHMSRRFQGVIKDISAMLKEVYGADATALVPGSGTFGMEAVARQFAGGQKVLIVRNGYFSYRWSQILEAGGITTGDRITVLKARRTGDGPQAPWAPAPIDDHEQGDRRAPCARTARRRGDLSHRFDFFQQAALQFVPGLFEIAFA